MYYRGSKNDAFRAKEMRGWHFPGVRWHYAIDSPTDSEKAIMVVVGLFIVCLFGPILLVFVGHKVAAMIWKKAKRSRFH